MNNLRSIAPAALLLGWFAMQAPLRGSVIIEGNQVHPSQSSALFTDGFEANDDYVSAWTSQTDSGGKLSISSDFARTGTYSSKITTGTTTTAYVTKDLAANHPEGAFCTFYFLLNDVTAVAASNGEMRLCALFDLSGNEQCRFSLYTESGSPFDVKRQNPTYFDDTTNAFAGYTTITASMTANAWHKGTIYYKPATAPGANNGILRTWIDGNAETTKTDIDSDTKLGAGRLRLGIPSHGWSTANGTIVYEDDVTFDAGFPANP